MIESHNNACQLISISGKELSQLHKDHSLHIIKKTGRHLIPCLAPVLQDDRNEKIYHPTICQGYQILELLLLPKQALWK